MGDNTAHAKLAPSAAERWMTCAQSVQGFAPDRGDTVFTREGTAAHFLGETCLSERGDAEIYVGLMVDLRTGEPRFVDPEQEEISHDGFDVFEVDMAMADGVNVYVSFVLSILEQYPDAELEVEQRIDLRHVHPDLWGTGDAVIYIPSLRRLYVIDLKYGRGHVVEVQANPQLMTYGVGAAHRLHNRGVDELVLVVVQPRAPHEDGAIRQFVATPMEIEDWEYQLGQAAALTQDPDQPFVAGEHCCWCPRSGSCPAYGLWIDQHVGVDLSAVYADEAELPQVDQVDLTRLGQIHLKRKTIEAWLKAVSQRALAEALAGSKIPGCKLVDTQAKRRYIDPEIAESELDFRGVPRDVFMVEKLATPAAIEKALGKARGAEVLAGLTEKKSSGVTLVAESDKRPAKVVSSGFAGVDTED